jgi:hypothetical protein
VSPRFDTPGLQKIRFPAKDPIWRDAEEWLKQNDPEGIAFELLATGAWSEKPARAGIELLGFHGTHNTTNVIFAPGSLLIARARFRQNAMADTRPWPSGDSEGGYARTRP